MTEAGEAPGSEARAAVEPATPAAQAARAPVTRNHQEIAGLAAAARAAAQAHAAVAAALRPGVTTAALNDVASRTIDDLGAQALFRGYTTGSNPPFPADACISVNEEVVHGIPGDRVILRGDVVSIDIGLRLEGWCADMARTLLVPGGTADRRARTLINATRRVLSEAVRRMKPGVAWRSIAAQLEDLVFASGFGLVTEYVGHGIGRELHEPPKVPCYASGFTGDWFTLEPGMVLAVEPILTVGRGELLRPDGALPSWRTRVRIRPDAWTVVTEDGLPACHEERMVLVSETGARVLSEATPNGDDG